MPNVNFYLKKPEGVPPHSLVYLQMRYHGKKFIYSCRFNISPKNWDRKKQVVRSRSQTEDSKQIKLNDLLTALKRECTQAYNTLLSTEGIPTNLQLKAALDKWMKRGLTDEKEGMTFFKFIDGLIDGTIGDKKNIGTIKVYQTARKHLTHIAAKQVEKAVNTALQFF